MVSPTSSPATTSTGSGHHTGGLLKPTASGNVLYAHSVPTSTSFRNPNAMAAMGTPINAPKTSRPRYWRDRRSSTGSGDSPGAGGSGGPARAGLAHAATGLVAVDIGVVPVRRHRGHGAGHR